MGRDELERVRERFHACFDHEWPTGLRPDEVNYTPGVTPPDVARQLCNVWKADRCSPRPRWRRATPLGRAARGAPGHAAVHDNMIWKPPGSKALLAHQDAGLRGLLGAAEHDDVLDRARRHARRHGHDLLRPRLEPLAAARRRAGSSTRPTTGPATAQRRAGRVRRRRRVGADRGAGRRLRVPRRLALARLAAERAARPRAACDHQPHDDDRHALAPDQRARDLQPLPAARASPRWTRRSSRSCGARTATARPFIDRDHQPAAA